MIPGFRRQGPGLFRFSGFPIPGPEKKGLIKRPAGMGGGISPAGI
jgi:hypothetical protein